MLSYVLDEKDLEIRSVEIVQALIESGEDFDFP